MAILLFPGRHLLTTRFQERYLADLLRTGEIREVVFAITSANQANSRYNPLPLEVRAVGVDRFARDVCAPAAVRWRIVPVPHYGPTARFADFLLKEIREGTDGELTLAPAVMKQFEDLGFGVLTAELEAREPPRYCAPTPIEVLKRAVAADDPLKDAEVAAEISAATASMWRDFPDVLRRVVRLYRDPLLTEQGSLTEMRNYSTYAAGMGDRAILELKYQDIRQAIRPGRIADEGCADGALLVPIARDFPDSDLIGIEITGEFMARCRERQRALEYGGTYIHFHQRNITEAIFSPDSIDTTICNSTTHELWSYGSKAETVRAYLREKFRQTRRGGRIIIRDVVGPDDRLDEVLLWCNPADGENKRAAPDMKGPTLQKALEAQSTAARFETFCAWYLADQVASGHRTPSEMLQPRRERIDHRDYFVLPLHHAMEFLLKKDYTDNWRSEMNEEFCFWSFEDWKRELRNAGFNIIERSETPAAGSRAYCSGWIVKNRFEGKVELWRKSGSGLRRLDSPATNMVLVGEKS
ncbi:MAG TPA: methyltransferase domain-containing protein [Phycisphaerae bacterium]|nr:methyltransferase domain-containing protein [Phycisphaerae bacterium]